MSTTWDFSPPSTLRILCFGASITGGFHLFGLAKHPYSQSLKRNLEQAFPNTRLDVVVDSSSGDVVVGGSYIRRLEAQTAATKAKYDWVIVQGGGNDLGQGTDPQTILEALKKIWEKALASGAKVLALTVTETSSPSTQVRAKYDTLNNMVLHHRANANGFYVCDVSREIPFHNMEPEKRMKIWDDGLHFTKAGYDLIGHVIAERLKELLLEPPAPKM